MKTYYKWINTARGIGMILVVLGHAISDTLLADNGAVWGRFCFNLIYSFHMPLFFFLSGYVSVKLLTICGSRQKVQYILERFRRLMIPYFIVGTLYIPLKLLFKSEVNSSINWNEIVFDFIAGLNPNYQLWTLYVLFLCATIVCLLNQCPSWILVSASVLLYGIDMVYPLEEILVLHQLFQRLPFFILGLICAEKKFEIKKSNIRIGFGIIVLVFLNVFEDYIQIPYLQMIIAVVGIWTVCLISKRIENRKTFLLDIIGMYSMDIYVMGNLPQVLVRSVFLNYLHISRIICCMISTLFGLVLPVVVSKYFIRKFKVTSILILGK